MSDRSMVGKSAFVTGAAGGMGRAISEALAGAGASVLAADLDADRGEEFASSARSAGLDVRFLRVDVSRDEEVEEAVRTATEPTGRLDCAVNAAAIEFERVPLAECSDDDWDRMMSVNLSSVFFCMRHEIRAMLAGGAGGSIVNIASTNAFKPQRNQPAYTASKHGVLGLSRSAAFDYARHGIRVNAIAPGAIDTPMLANAIDRSGLDPQNVARHLSLLGRFGTPAEIGQAALYLCSDASSYTTGHTLAVDGGYLSH